MAERKNDFDFYGAVNELEKTIHEFKKAIWIRDKMEGVVLDIPKNKRTNHEEGFYAEGKTYENIKDIFFRLRANGIQKGYLLKEE